MVGRAPAVKDVAVAGERGVGGGDEQLAHGIATREGPGEINIVTNRSASLTVQNTLILLQDAVQSDHILGRVTGRRIELIRQGLASCVGAQGQGSTCLKCGARLA